MKKFLGLFAGLGLISVLNGCGGSATCTGTTFGAICLGVVSQGTLTIGTTMTGTGSVVAATPLAGASTNNSFRVAFTLNAGGTVTLVANSDATLGSGVKVEFKRNGTTLEVRLKGSGPDKDISSSFVGVDASTALTYQIDIHNTENPIHVLMWDESVTDFQNTTPRVDDETGTPSSGSGTYWGVELSDATVSSLAVGAQSFTEP